MSNLAISGGEKTISEVNEELFHWPIVTGEDIAAVTEVLKKGTMSGTDITKEFEKEYAGWNKTSYALGCCNGTAAITAAMWACGAHRVSPYVSSGAPRAARCRRSAQGP